MRSVGRRWGSLFSYTVRNQTGCCKLAVASGLYNAGVPADRVRTGFGWAIRAMFQEKKPSAARALESYLAYRQVAIGSLLAGGAGSLLSLIKMMHSLGGGNLEELGIALNVACLSLGYAIFLNLLLLPVGFLLRKTLGELEQADKVD